MRKRHKRSIAFIVFVVVICICVVLDRLTKYLAVINLAGGHAQPFIPGFLDFYLVYNVGAAWGMFEGAQAIFLIIASLTLVAMVVYLAINKLHAVGEVIALGLVAGGAIGNGIDRAISGQVVDFVRTLFVNFPLFNVADSCITLGAILFIIMLLFGYRTPKPALQSDIPDDTSGAEPPITSPESAGDKDGTKTLTAAPSSDQDPIGGDPDAPA